MEWIENKIVLDCMQDKDMSKLSFLGSKICYSKDYKCCLMVRKHSAWFIKEEGWRDSNSIPEHKNEGRWILNFYSIRNESISASWYKIFIPLKYAEIALISEGNYYKIKSANKIIKGRFENHFPLMKYFLTGLAQQEHEIEEKFEMLNISSI